MIEGSREYLTASVWIAGADGLPVDLDGATASIRVGAGPWVPATLTPGHADGSVLVSVLVGPGTATGAPAPGGHEVYVRVDDATEAPILRAGTLRVERIAA